MRWEGTAETVDVPVISCPFERHDVKLRASILKSGE